MSDSPHKPIDPRTAAALGVVGLAAVLAGLGLVLALRQTRLLADQRMAEARSEAERFVAGLNEDVLQRVDEALAKVIEGCLRNRRSGELDADPLDGDRRPSWLGDLLYWDEHGLRLWPGLPPRPGAPPASAEHYRALRTLARSRLLPHLLSAGTDPNQTQARLIHDYLGEEHVVLAHAVVEPRNPQSAIVAASLDLHRLRATYLTAKMAGLSDRMSLVEADALSPSWSQPLAPGMPFWALQPTAEFIAKQRTDVRRQTGIFVTITVLALIALLVVVWGLTHVVQREIALSQLKSSFVADVSHELKTPLALIRLFGETLAEGRVSSADKRQEYYEIITRESARLSNLIDNILDFSRIDAGRKEYRMVGVDVGQVVRQTYESYRHDLAHHDFEHHLRIADDLPEIYADADAVSRALLNLMSNAVKYSQEERYLAVAVTPETRRGRHGVLISLEDRGIGIPPESRRHLFDGFFRVPDERVRQRRGAGLGLALVKHIVDAHGGSVDVESRLVKGSTFRIFLPQREGQQRSEATAQRDS